MPAGKTHSSFRLSQEAKELLKALATFLGQTKTAILERIIRDEADRRLK